MNNVYRCTVALLCILLGGCFFPLDVSFPSAYPLLSGRYVYHYYGSYDIVDKTSIAIAYDFDYTTKARYYSNVWGFTSANRWVNVFKEPFRTYIEWKVENGRFFSRLWRNPYSEWQDYKFEYIDSDRFTLDGLLYKRTN